MITIISLQHFPHILHFVFKFIVVESKIEVVDKVSQSRRLSPDCKKKGNKRKRRAKKRSHKKE